MDNYDLVLLALIIGPCVVFAVCVIVANGLHQRRREKAARGRLKFLLKHVAAPLRLSDAWRWHYRCGYRKGRKKGREEGIDIGLQRAQRIEVVNRCVPHGSNLHPQLVRLYDGTIVQGWFCQNWAAHTVPVETGKIEHPFAAMRFAAQKQLQSQLLPLTDTQEIPIMHPPPKKVRLS